MTQPLLNSNFNQEKSCGDLDVQEFLSGQPNLTQSKCNFDLPPPPPYNPTFVYQR